MHTIYISKFSRMITTLRYTNFAIWFRGCFSSPSEVTINGMAQILYFVLAHDQNLPMEPGLMGRRDFLFLLQSDAGCPRSLRLQAYEQCWRHFRSKCYGLDLCVVELTRGNDFEKSRHDIAASFFSRS